MEQASPRRRPTAGGYARGDEVRRRIIEAALRVFGENGYERASTRQIATEAGVNPPALQYYFDGKDGLHQACGQYIADHISQRLEAAYAVAAAVKPDDAAAAVDALCNIIDTLADLLLGSAQGEGWSRFIAQSQTGVSSQPAAQRQTEESSPGNSAFRQSMNAKIQSECTRLVSIATGRAADDVRTKLQTIAIIGQFAAFHLRRDSSLALLGWPDFYGERLQMLKEILRSQTHAILKHRLASDEAV
ncbi:CerR family C-terminal domain-containing protein [Bradyrhizobium sp. S69]|uniref:CerR family C-terminal domain-containing protein n=1 Tax=Bradyrhizobium sp. S69 TaxID=1641856 RepID=UPI00131BB2AF|nr:CerR family C-terminal domain-containing protein [Bradyrhizobium sp. S69]